MKYLCAVLFIGIFLGCTKRTDRTKPDDVGTAILQAVIENDTTTLKELFLGNRISLSGGINIAGVNTTNEHITDIAQFKNKSYSLIKVDTSSYEILGKRVRWINTNFKIDASYYSLSAKYSTDEKGKISIELIDITDLTKSCNNWISEPYCPRQKIKFKRIIWETDYWNKSFKSGQVELENQLETDIDYVKFRVILANGDEIFFNQTIISNKKIFAGDISIIEIPEMVDLFTGFSIQKDKVLFNVELIEVLPKPESSNCRKILEFERDKR